MSFSDPLPLAVHGPMHVQLIEPSVAGKVSTTVAPTAVDGPLLVATIV